MTLDELLTALFPAGHDARVEVKGILHGTAATGAGKEVTVLGVVNQSPLGIEGAIALAGHVLDTIRGSPGQPIVVLLDGKSQAMRRRDELLGLNEYLAHLTKCFTLAARQGHRTVGVLFGTIAAGAFISTGLVQDLLVGMPGGNPVVMDLPSIARVTKLPLDKLEEWAKDTSVFAPGLPHGLSIGAVAETWEEDDLAMRLQRALEGPANPSDHRDQLGLERKGRLKAAEIAKRVQAEAVAIHG